MYKTQWTSKLYCQEQVIQPLLGRNPHQCLGIKHTHHNVCLAVKHIHHYVTADTTCLTGRAESRRGYGCQVGNATHVDAHFITHQSKDVSYM